VNWNFEVHDHIFGNGLSGRTNFAYVADFTLNDLDMHLVVRCDPQIFFVAAFAPDSGQSAGDLNNQYPTTPGVKEVRPDANGFLKLSDKGITTGWRIVLQMDLWRRRLR
jgi:hypothetical protein